ncbi:MAG: glycoside hydrolase family 127 protein [Planctomycetes bacterium]|nr:glycoside hydrolase family 127 protein [Planctomycetota bacterium]
MIVTAALFVCLQGATLRPVPFTQVKLEDGFFAPRLATNRTVTIPTCLDRCEETQRIENFAVAGKVRPGKHVGALYNDSDVYKVLEGAAYALSEQRDPELEARVDGVIDLIAAAQEPDGYLNTYVQLEKPDQRWKNVRHGHELYCAGHLIEAAIAYEAATGKQKFLDVALKLAGCIDKEFGWGKHQEPTGHPELELALAKLARRTGERRWAELAKFFVDVRGKKDRGTELFGEYAQDQAPVREQKQIVGHAVRAMYLYCGMADLAGYFGDPTLSAPLDALWHDVVDTRMYLTGGIGNSAANEGFTVPYELPNDTAYCETCAGIGLSLWAHRMFLATGDPKYIDVLERASYNNVLSGVSLSGDKFFYDNVLATDSGAERVPWFDCSCCPTNVARFLPAMGERIYATDGESLDVCLFVASEADLVIRGTKVHVKQETNYPYDGTREAADRPREARDLRGRSGIPARVRVGPGWCHSRLVADAMGEFSQACGSASPRKAVAMLEDPSSRTDARVKVCSEVGL